MITLLLLGWSYMHYAESNLNTGLSNAARLLGCSVEDLILAVTTDRIQMGEDTVIHKLTLKQVFNN